MSFDYTNKVKPELTHDRKAFVMKLEDGNEYEYEQRQNPIWFELESVLKEHGVSNYFIYLHLETFQLFA